MPETSQARPVPHYRPATWACDFGLEPVPDFQPSVLSRTFSFHLNHHKGMPNLKPSYYLPDRMEFPDGYLAPSSASPIRKPRGEVGRASPNGYKLKDALSWTEGKYVEIQVG